MLDHNTSQKAPSAQKSQMTGQQGRVNTHDLESPKLVSIVGEPCGRYWPLIQWAGKGEPGGGHQARDSVQGHRL